MRAALAALLLLSAAPRAADAGICSNPCQIAPGALCVSLFQPGTGFVHSRLVPMGATVELQIGQQSGTCGGLTPLDAASVTVSASQTPETAAKPLAVGVTPKSVVTWTPKLLGPHYVTVARKDGTGTPARFIAVVSAELRKVDLAPSAAKGATLEMRWTPPLTAENAGFLRPRWPAPTSGHPRGPKEWSWSVPDGDYEVEWRAGAESALVPVKVTAAGKLPVAIPAAKLVVTYKKPARWALITLRQADGLDRHLCVQAAGKWAVRVPAGDTSITWTPASGDGDCVEGPAAAGGAVVTVKMAAKGSKKISLPAAR